MQTANISDWKIVNTPIGCCLIGRVSEHPNQRAFTEPFQITSLLRSIDFDKGVTITQNTTYTLLTPPMEVN